MKQELQNTTSLEVLLFRLSCRRQIISPFSTRHLRVPCRMFPQEKDFWGSFSEETTVHRNGMVLARSSSKQQVVLPPGSETTVEVFQPSSLPLSSQRTKLCGSGCKNHVRLVSPQSQTSVICSSCDILFVRWCTREICVCPEAWLFRSTQACWPWDRDLDDPSDPEKRTSDRSFDVRPGTHIALFISTPEVQGRVQTWCIQNSESFIEVSAQCSSWTNRSTPCAPTDAFDRFGCMWSSHFRSHSVAHVICLVWLSYSSKKLKKFWWPHNRCASTSRSNLAHPKSTKQNESHQTKRNPSFTRQCYISCANWKQ